MKNEELDEPRTSASCVEDDRERVEEDDLDVEDDEEHRRQVEADREALLPRRARRRRRTRTGSCAPACARFGRVAKTNDMTIIDAGIATANMP